MFNYFIVFVTKTKMTMHYMSEYYGKKVSILKFSILWDFRQRILIISYRRFGTTVGLIFEGHAVLGVLDVLEGVTDSLPRNVGGQLSIYTEKNHGRAKISHTVRQKPDIT